MLKILNFHKRNSLIGLCFISLVVFSSFSVSIEIPNKIKFNGNDAIIQAEESVNLAYENLVLLENYGFNTTSFFNQLSEAITYLGQASDLLDVNETEAVLLANTANQIALTIYDDSSEIIYNYQNYSYLNPILIYIGIILTLIFIIICSYYAITYLKNRQREKILESTIELQEEEENEEGRE